MEFGENIFLTHGIIISNICEVKTNCEKQLTVTRYVKTNKYEWLLNRQQNLIKIPAIQKFLSSSTLKSASFQKIYVS